MSDNLEPNDLVVNIWRYAQLSPDLKVRTNDYALCDLSSISDLLGVAAGIVTNTKCPSFIGLMGHDDILQMIYDNGNLTLDDKSCGGLYEIENIINEIDEWFRDSSNLVSCILGYTHEEMGVNITDDKLTAEAVSGIIASVCHYILSEMDHTNLPLCLVDCMKGDW
jgi:hypothetical protein